MVDISSSEAKPGISAGTEGSHDHRCIERLPYHKIGHYKEHEPHITPLLFQTESSSLP